MSLFFSSASGALKKTYTCKVVESALLVGEGFTSGAGTAATAESRKWSSSSGADIKGKHQGARQTVNTRSINGTCKCLHKEV